MKLEKETHITEIEIRVQCTWRNHVEIVDILPDSVI
jgi:hypothetical protein